MVLSCPFSSLHKTESTSKFQFDYGTKAIGFVTDPMAILKVLHDVLLTPKEAFGFVSSFDMSVNIPLNISMDFFAVLMFNYYFQLQNVV